MRPFCRNKLTFSARWDLKRIEEIVSKVKVEFKIRKMLDVKELD